MNLHRRTFGIGLVAAAVLLAGGVRASAAHPSVDVVAANWKFTPATIVAHVGKETTLRLTSSEGVHGIESAELGIAKTMIMPGKFVEVKFTPKKAGTYVVHCAIMCGAGHADMALTIKVVA